MLILVLVLVLAGAMPKLRKEGNVSKAMEGVVQFEAKQGEALHRSSQKPPKAREGVHIRARNGRLLEARSAEHCLDRVGHRGRTPPPPTLWP